MCGGSAPPSPPGGSATDEFHAGFSDEVLEREKDGIGAIQRGGSLHQQVDDNLALITKEWCERSGGSLERCNAPLFSLSQSVSQWRTTTTTPTNTLHCHQLSLLLSPHRWANGGGVVDKEGSSIAEATNGRRRRRRCLFSPSHPRQQQQQQQRLLFLSEPRNQHGQRCPPLAHTESAN